MKQLPEAEVVFSQRQGRYFIDAEWPGARMSGEATGAARWEVRRTLKGRTRYTMRLSAAAAATLAHRLLDQSAVLSVRDV